MAMLEKAQEAKKGDKADDAKDDDKKSKKRKKHPSASEPSEPPEQDEEQGDSDGAEDETGGDEGAQSPQDASDDSGDSQAEPPEDQGEAPQGQDDEQDQQGQPGQQSATPVPDPAAPGAGDDTSGGDDTPPEAQDQATGGGPDDAEISPETGGPDLPQVPMTPALKEEYLRLDQLLNQYLYGMPNHVIAGHVLQQLYPSGPHKVSSAATACATLMREIFVKAKAPPQLTLPFMRDVVAHVLSLGEQVKQIPYSQQEIAAIMGSSLESALHMFGVKRESFQHMQQLVPRSVFAKHARNYTKLQAHVAPALTFNKSQPHPEPGGQPPAAAPGPQGPQGAPPAAQGAPPAPPGGALSQGAAAAAPPPAQPGAA